MASHTVAAGTARGVWWRHTRAHHGPLGQPDPPVSGRWQRGDVVAAVYLADSPDTAWAEWYRYLAEWSMPPLDDLPRALWRLAVDLDRVADLSTTAALDAVGLAAPRPSSDGWQPFQAVGERCFAAGYRAILAPSAARPTGRVLCVFRTVAPPPGVRPCPPPERVDVPPVPPRGLTT
jgi:RES domain-containing protein